MKNKKNSIFGLYRGVFPLSTIRNIQSTLSSLVDAQTAAVSTLSSALKNVRTDKNTAERSLQSNVQALVIVGDKERYDALTKASQDAGAGKGHDYTQVVADWTQQDAQNRRERKELDEKWESRQTVALAAAELKEEIDIVRSALGDIRPEIDAFDETTAKIKEHNERYKGNPKAIITEENHDGFEKFRLLPFVKWLVGWPFGKWGGEHNAYRAIGKYTKQYGDYYEKATLISSMRKNEEKLEVDRQKKQVRYEELSAVVNRMDTLDRSHRGSEGIASGVRSLVKSLLNESALFGSSLINSVKGEAAQGAALAAAKIRRLNKIEDVAKVQLSNAEKTLEQVKDPSEYLSGVLHKVGGKTLYFDTSGVEISIGSAVRKSRNAAREINSASDGIDDYTATRGDGLAAMEKDLERLGDIEVESNKLSLDFSPLKDSVKSAVDAYDREQAEIARLAREAAKKAADAQRKKMNDVFNDISRAQTQRRTHTPSPSISLPKISTPRPSIKTGGIASRSKPSIKMGGGGIRGRR